MGGYNSFEQAPTYENPGMRVSPQEMAPQQQVRQEYSQQQTYDSPVLPQFNAPPQGGLQAQRGGGGGQSAYSQQLNRFIGAGGQFNNFKPRMGAVGPQYRNGITPRPMNGPPHPGLEPIDPNKPGPPDGNIDLPRPILPTWG